MNKLMTSVSPISADPIANEKSFWDQLPENGKVLDLIPEGDPRLREVSEPFIFEDQEKTYQLVLDMGATMRYNRGIGLSAVQFGLMKRVFVIEIGEDLPLAIFNPIIVDQGPEIEMEEGCLSFPGITVKVKRPSFVKIRFRNFNNEVITHRFEGLSARCLLHEYDHLEGLVMKDRVSRLRYEQATKTRKKRTR